MKKIGQILAIAAVIVVVEILAFGPIAGDTKGDWTQWGGPGQKFQAASSGLATEWPEEGPPELWSRELGDGYSAILAEAGKLYTMYRTDEKEVVISLDAATGKTLWEHRYDHSPHEGHVAQFGEGPRATPLISGNRIYTIGVAGKMHCLNKKSGKVVWSHDLWKDFGGTILNHGYSSSPIEYGNNIITLVGGEGHGVVAFDKKTGEVAWKNQDFENSYSTPRILEVDGQKQLVVFMATELIAVDPENGALKWSYPHENQWKQNIAMPVMADSKHLFLSSPTAGARGLKLTNKGDKTEVEEIWSTRKIQFYHVSTVRDGDYVYGSTGTMGPAFMAAVNIKTGEIAWRERGFAKANLLSAEGRIYILDENGMLGLASVSPEEMKLHGKAEVLEKAAWTVPTIVGRTMYLRDTKKIVALDLGSGSKS